MKYSFVGVGIMSNKKQIILTAIITFFVTGILVFVLVAGSAVFKAEDPAEVIAQIRGKF